MRWKPEILRIGDQRTPLLIFDDVDPALTKMAKEGARTAKFDVADTYYPGIRATLGMPYVTQIVGAIYHQLYDIYSIPPGYQVGLKQAVYSLITLSPGELSLAQTMPHIDATSAFNFAILHYLNEGQHGGTTFYRHRATDCSQITDDKEQQYFNCLNREMTRDSARGSYITASDSSFEQIGKVAYKAGRIVVYPGNLLHSTEVDIRSDISSALDEGRLTANVFINFK